MKEGRSTHLLLLLHATGIWKSKQHGFIERNPPGYGRRDPGQLHSPRDAQVHSGPDFIPNRVLIACAL